MTHTNYVLQMLTLPRNTLLQRLSCDPFRLSTCLAQTTVVLLASCILLVGEVYGEHASTKLLRFPDIHGDQIAFVHGGDIWKASVEGGTAERLTAHSGLELFPKFSPDGKQIAFTGQYDGDEQVYVMDTDGGSPKQLTFYPARGPLPDRWGYDNQVYGWTNDGASVMFRSMRHSWGLTDTRLYTVGLDGSLPTALPMRVSGAGDYSPDGSKVVFSPLVRDFRTWKRYEGGWAQDLYIFDLKTYEFEQITDNKRADRDPMWIGDRIYFTSDRTGTLNLFYYDVKSKQTTQVTESTKHDVRWPSKGGNTIVFEQNGELHVFNTTSGDIKDVQIHVPNDELARRPRHISVADQVSDVGLSPTAKRAVVSARGDIFTVPQENGAVRQLTRSSNAHDKDPNWSPDGSQIVFISDADGEEELYLIDQKGLEPMKQLTDGHQAMLYRPVWSPNGKQVAFSDKDGKLSVINVDSKETVEVVDSDLGTVSDYTWSPNGGYLAFSMTQPNDFTSLYIWSASDKKLHQLTDDTFNESEPVWDPKGKYLYYFSDREFAPQIGTTEWNFVQNRETGIFAIALQKEGKHPYPPKSDDEKVDSDKAKSKDDAADEDEAGDEDLDDDSDDGQDDGDEPDADAEEEEDHADAEDDGETGDDQQDADKVDAKKSDKNDKESKDAKKKKDKKPIVIDFDGIADRVTRLPISADNYGGLEAVKGFLLYVRTGPFYYGRDSGVPTELIKFSHEDREAKTLVSPAGGYSVSHDGKNVLVRTGGQWKLYPIKSGEPKALPMSKLETTVIPSEEWNQIFHEVWRRFRDFFYVENMHGYDWEALRDQYAPLLEHVAHRSDLNYVIGEMIGELNVGHAYNAGGDFDRPKRESVALLGAQFDLDAAKNRYRFSKIYEGQNEESIYRSPLTETGVDVSEGDYLMRIDGVDLTGGNNPYRLLRFKGNDAVTLTVSKTGTLDDCREVVVNPLSSESNLVYLDMILTNRRRVAKLTDGKIGYMHIPDMGENGIREFNKWYYSQLRKDGLVVDVRSNGGGNVSQMIIERLRRKLLATGFRRGRDVATTYPDAVFHGHLICLLDEDSASDGDIFPAMFREAKLGRLVGKRSWGGVIGITNHGALIDGGAVNVPEFGFTSADGEWIIEGHGVDPDIVVENDPKSLIEGRDPQLERGVQELQGEIKAEPRSLPKRPAPPVKTK